MGDERLTSTNGPSPSIEAAAVPADYTTSYHADLLGPPQAAPDSVLYQEDPPADATTRPSRGLLRPRTVVVGVLLLAVIALGVIFGPNALRILQARNTSISTPDRVALLSRDHSDAAASTVDYLKTAVEAGVAVDSSVGAVYTGSGGEPHSIIFIGGTGLFMAPEKQLTALFGLVSDQADGVDGVRTVPAGPLGGFMKCGTTQTDTGSMAVCGWADYGSVAIALFPGRGVEDAANLMLEMRNAMEHR